MRTIKFIIAGMVIIFMTVSCGGNSQTELAKLKKQQALLERKIRDLEKADDPFGR